MSKLRYVAYIRKSTESVERQTLSIPAQKRKIKELFPDISVVKWLEESMSAFKPGRPDFEEMMQMLRDNEADGIVAWHPDRLSRNEVDAAVITYGIRTGLIKDLKFGSYFFDNSPEGIMMLQNVMSHSQYYSSKLSKDVKRGNEERRKSGQLTGRALEGYINVLNPNDSSRTIMAKDEVRFNLRRQMWDLMLTGEYSVPEVTDVANNQWGYRTRGNKRYSSGYVSRNAIYNMFTNIRYAGKIPIPGSASEYEDASYPAMVTMDEFNHVQSILGRKDFRIYNTKKEFTFRPLLHCGECGCMITAEEKTKRYKNGTSKTYTYYHCTGARGCSQTKYVTEGTLEQQFIQLLGKYTILPQFKEWALETLEQNNEIETTDINNILETQNKAIEAAHKEMKRLIKMAAKELIDDEQFKEEKKDLDKEIKQLEKELVETKERADNWYDSTVEFLELAVHGREKFIGGDIQAKKEVLSNLGQNPILMNGKLQITSFPFLEHIAEAYPELEAEYLNLPTLPQQRQKVAFERLRLSWLRMRDSN
ncbi:MAG TPA: recombinase family protein [Candidatus Saccharimonadales bacterium]|nr:recombinase family protein [Candidatus Saccharimonadales bacterium]